MNIEKMPGPAYEAENDKVVDPAMERAGGGAEKEKFISEILLRNRPDLLLEIYEKVLKNPAVKANNFFKDLPFKSKITLLGVMSTGLVACTPTSDLNTNIGRAVERTVKACVQNSDSKACKSAPLVIGKEVILRPIDKNVAINQAEAAHKTAYQKVLMRKYVDCGLETSNHEKKACRSGVAEAKKVLRDWKISKKQNQAQRNSGNGPYSRAQPGGMSPAAQAQAERVKALKKAQAEFKRTKPGHFK